MKKLLFSMAAVATISFASCSDDDDNGASCEDLTADITATQEAYIEDDSQENCEEYRSALEAYVDSDCENAAEFEMFLEGLDCEE